MFYTIFLVPWGLFSATRAGYVIEDDYTVNDFFSMFDFFTDDDPTHGYVNYVDQETARHQGLVGDRDGLVYMGVDHTEVAEGRGRNSVRLSSKKAYNHGLVVLDLQHMPGGQCGSWPAFWMLGPDWPHGGEIDIIEGVNSQSSNEQTLHTNPGCSIHDRGTFTGELTTFDCDVNAEGQSTNQGCKIVSNDTASYGRGFNENQGGVYATEWSSEMISIWYFPRDMVPDDLSGPDPDPGHWDKPIARFEGGCDIDKHFQDHKLIFDVTFCGDWAGSAWAGDMSCSSQASSCEDYVRNRPEAFKDTNWQINSLRVYRPHENGTDAIESTSEVESDEDEAYVPLTEEVADTPVSVGDGTPDAIEDADSVEPYGREGEDGNEDSEEEAEEEVAEEDNETEEKENETGEKLDAEDVPAQFDPSPMDSTSVEGTAAPAEDTEPGGIIGMDGALPMETLSEVTMTFTSTHVVVAEEVVTHTETEAIVPTPEPSTFVTLVKRSGENTGRALEWPDLDGSEARSSTMRSDR